MASEAQILANRANARKSTGPRTPAGKAIVSQNAVTHGFLARQTVIQGEDPGEFTFYRDRILGSLAPAGDAEVDMAERIVGLAWRLRRAERLQTEAFDTLYERMATGSPGGSTLAEGVAEADSGAPGGAGRGDDRLLGRMVVEDFSNGRVLDRLLVYERRIENSLYRTMRELREQKQMRLAGVPAEAVGALSARTSRGTGLPSASLLGQALPVGWDHGRDGDPKRDLSRLGTHAHAAHRQDAEATRTPDGVTTNLSPSQGLLFKTKPNSVGAGAGRALGGLGTSDGASRNELCKTKPIEGVSSLKCEVGSKESRVAGLSTSDFTLETAAEPHLCETKPISPGDPSSLPAVRRVA